MQDLYDCIFMDKDEQILCISKKNSIAVGEVIQTRQENRYERHYNGSYNYNTYTIKTIVEKIKQKTDKEIICLCTIEEIRR
jgi:tRNA A22 N-methylase